MTEGNLSRLQVYDELRRMHDILKDIPERDDTWEQNSLDAVDAVLYLAEGVFALNESLKERPSAQNQRLPGSDDAFVKSVIEKHGGMAAIKKEADAIWQEECKDHSPAWREKNVSKP